VGTLYVVGAPAGGPDNLTLRAKRILGEAALVASDHPGAQELLAHHGIAVSLVERAKLAQPATLSHILDFLKNADVALLCTDVSAGTVSPGQAVIHAALERNHPVVPIPGPALPLTALVISGLPADSFVYLGQLPRQRGARGALLASIATEHRTLVAQVSPEGWPGILSELYDHLGDRPLAVTSSGQHVGSTWRGTIAGALECLPEQPSEALLVLVIGGASEKAEPWEEEHLRAELHARLHQGLGAKETSRQLAAESGWPRRQIYRLAVEAGKHPVGE
jgi:16S rRNA (cytidine1402-2'-O)-methyltransferase